MVRRTRELQYRDGNSSVVLELNCFTKLIEHRTLTTTRVQ